jgi:hypothetical protein
MAQTNRKTRVGVEVVRHKVTVSIPSRSLFYANIDSANESTYDKSMNSIEFETELSGDCTLAVPPEVAERLPKSGRITVVVLVPDDVEDEQWRRAAYEHFMRDDDSEDAVYDAYQ